MGEEDPLDHTGRRVLITGGTKGVGKGIAVAFLRNGASVVVCARTEPHEPPRVADNQAHFVACDVRDPEQLGALVETTVATVGGVDVLVNNAGGAPPSTAETSSPRFNERILALNLLAPLTLSQAAYPHLKASPGGGVIINVASVSGMRANPEGVAYGAAKAGLINVTETLAVEWGPAVRVVTLTLGPMVTELAHLFYGNEAGIAEIGATIPMGRMGEPADAGDVCLFLASPLARWLSGTNVIVHGGGELPAYLLAARRAGST